MLCDCAVCATVSMRALNHCCKTMATLIRDRHLEAISRSCCSKWKNLVLHFELGRTVIDDIERLAGEEDEKRLKFLLKWRQLKGSEVTYERLIAALRNIGCQEDAEYVQKLLQQPLESEGSESAALCELPQQSSSSSSGTDQQDLLSISQGEIAVIKKNQGGDERLGASCVEKLSQEGRYST